MGLVEKRGTDPRQLSGGQQRVAFARALAMPPSRMVFDESTAALDPEMIGGVFDGMAAPVNEGTRLVVSYERTITRAVANQVIFGDEAQTVEEGHPDEIFYCLVPFSFHNFSS